jgi:hypothetical protein
LLKIQQCYREPGPDNLDKKVHDQHGIYQAGDGYFKYGGCIKNCHEKAGENDGGKHKWNIGDQDENV